MNSSASMSVFLLGRYAPLVVSLLGGALLSGCGALDRPLRTPDVSAAIKADLPPAVAPKPSAVVPAKVSEALAEPPPPVVAPAPEPRLDLLVNNAQAREVFLAIVADTRYSMLMHPDVSGTLSVTLRGVTVLEALEAIRDVYGYDFKIEGRRITVYAPTLQTRVFSLNYPTSQRQGSSELRVSSGAALQQSSSGGTTNNTANATNGTSSQPENSRVSTTSKSDFWGELTGAIKSLVGNGEGRSVVASPQAGILAVRAMPEELRQVDKFLKATQASVERQVMLEAKVVEVELRDGYQSGVNWGAFNNDGSTQVAAGVIGSGVTSTNAFVQGTTTINGAVAFPSVATGGGLFGLALATSQFGAVLGFLETQGDVQTLSSPRVATLNNQKAVLKVGTDEFFVTNVSGGTNSTNGTSSTTTTSTLPTVTLTPFFSGISLDVTPQIDDGVNVTLHVHPSLTTVTEKSKQIDLGSAGNFKLPLASSAVNETDTLVRIQDGSIVAIGGLMQLESSRNASGIPGTTSMPGLGALFGNRATQGRKKEVIVLIKPTIIRSSADWEAQGRRARAAIDDMDATRARVIQLDGSAK
ncbi:secretin N-terminal domain-containing protein [Rhodoferax mekongensis]|uniref:Secretin N-terminal domain-containing protein n=1 Tax=Rhodoferax mekongensis TaxID=3068341 RepID=A0ABZ0B0Q8_9BURK|nr:secretin N-terminal domain-containing protein [Rhodoferax sp. TBRC 17307]WNO05210.1 secretin N-terminal domain-containing protein [Rhodoferax sp. TBRC 17307]